MGVFDTMYGYTECPKCSSLVDTDIQFKWNDPMMASYYIGDYIGGYEPLHILSTDHVVCPNCNEHFQSTAIGRFGYLYGFSNPEQMKNIEPLLPSAHYEDRSVKINLVISPSLKNNPKEVVRLFQEAYLEDPTKVLYYIGNESFEYEPHVCRWNALISPEKIRPKVGDTVYYDNRRSIHYDYWELKNEKFTVTEVVLDEGSQLYRCTIDNPASRFENICENHLIDEQERNERADKMESLVQQVISASKGEGHLPFLFSLHGRGFIYTMKEKGLIPQDFDMDKAPKRDLFGRKKDH